MMHKRAQTNISLSNDEISNLLKYFPNGVCSFDFEMTGLSPLFDHIIEIAAIKITPDAQVKTFHALINPLIPLPERTKKYHGITNEELRDRPTIKYVIRDFAQFYGNFPLIAHNAQFDASFLVRSLKEQHIELSLSDIFDSCRFARNIFKKAQSPPRDHKLSTLAEYFNFDFTHHVALEDSIIALKVFSKLINLSISQDKGLKDLSFLYKLKSFDKNYEVFLPKKLKGIETFVQNQTLISIKYKGGSNPNASRVIRPLAIMNMPNGLILYAHCQESDKNKYYKLKKIHSFSSITEKNDK